MPYLGRSQVRDNRPFVPGRYTNGQSLPQPLLSRFLDGEVLPPCRDDAEWRPPKALTWALRIATNLHVNACGVLLILNPGGFAARRGCASWKIIRAEALLAAPVMLSCARADQDDVAIGRAGLSERQ